MASREPSDAEVDAAFAELITQFDDRPASPRPPSDVGPPSGPPLGWRVHHAPTDEQLDAVDDGIDPIPPLPPMRISTTAKCGAGLLVLAVVLTALMILDLRLPVWIGWLAFGSLIGGSALLLSRLPRARDDGDDGAQV